MKSADDWTGYEPLANLEIDAVRPRPHGFLLEARGEAGDDFKLRDALRHAPGSTDPSRAWARCCPSPSYGCGGVLRKPLKRRRSAAVSEGA